MVKEEPVRIIGTSARIFSLEDCGEGYTLTCKAAADITVHMRLKLKRQVTRAEGLDENGNRIPVDWAWDGETSTVLLTFDSTNAMTTVNLT